MKRARLTGWVRRRSARTLTPDSADIETEVQPPGSGPVYTAKMRMKLTALLVLLASLSLQAQSARYYVAFLRPDPKRKALSPTENRRIQNSHMINIRELWQAGDLVASGPCDDSPTTISGVFIFKVPSLRVAQQIAVHDPTVLKHRDTADVHAWQGPPGIGDEYTKLHRADPDTPDKMQVHPLGVLYHGTAWGPGDPTLVAHESYIEQLRAQGRLGAAGGIEAPDELVGLAIFKAVPMEDAQLWLSRDPAVRARVLRVEWHRWLTADHVLPW